jgi:hypothetical protein
MEIKPVRIPRSMIREIPPPVVTNTPPPVISGLEVPVVEVPNPVIEYPTIDVPTREEFEGQLGQQQSQPQEEPQETRDLPEPAVTIDVPVVGEVELPPVAPLVTAGATAVVTTTVVLVSNIVLGQLKQALDGPLKRLLEPKKKKIKLKQKKPVLHYVREEDKVNVFEYSVKGTKLITTTDKPEQYIRDQVEMSTVYEYDNKLIINDDIEEMFTKEGAKRFKKHFTPAKSIVKKLSAKFSI